MLSAVAGMAVCLAALWGVFHWWSDFLTMLRGLAPLSFFFGGLVAVIAGISSLKSKPFPAKGPESSGEESK